MWRKRSYESLLKPDVSDFNDTIHNGIDTAPDPNSSSSIGPASALEIVSILMTLFILLAIVNLFNKQSTLFTRKIKINEN